MLKTSQAAALKLLKQMGFYAFMKWSKNLGMDAEDVIATLYGTPTVVRKPHLYIA